MKLLKANERWWTLLNIVAFSVLVYVLIRGTSASNRSGYDYEYDGMLESGKWGLRFLLLSLSMTPLNTYLGWRAALKLRKPAGLWAFGFAVLHVFLLVTDNRFGSLVAWLTFPISTFIILGMVGALILSAMALTSNQRAMRGLGKSWKRLHRLVYAAGILLVLHAILATTSSKKMGLMDPQAIHELKLYAALLTLLLVVRLSMVRRVLLQAVRLPGRWSSRSTA